VAALRRCGLFGPTLCERFCNRSRSPMFGESRKAESDGKADGNSRVRQRPSFVKREVSGQTGGVGFGKGTIENRGPGRRHCQTASDPPGAPISKAQCTGCQRKGRARISKLSWQMERFSPRATAVLLLHRQISPRRHFRAIPSLGEEKMGPCPGADDSTRRTVWVPNTCARGGAERVWKSPIRGQ
jgi:hypothetical protein